MNNFLWFSRHQMSGEQLSDLQRILGDVEVTQINGTAPNVHVPFIDANGNEQPPLKELVTQFDEVGLVLPIGLQSQILPFCPNGRFLASRNKRVIADGGKVNFVFDGWFETTEINIVTKDL